MKLYQTYTSPFPTRVRLVLYAKGLSPEIIEPPGFHATQESKGDYFEINPIGRVPALVTDAGQALPESEVICEYLEETYPDPPTLPPDPWGRAQVRLISRLCDFYLVMAMRPLFAASGMSRRRWDQPAIEKGLAEVETALGYIEAYFGEGAYAVGDRLTWADGALLPQLQLAYEWAPALFGSPSPLGRHPKLARYWSAIAGDTIAARLLQETREAIAKEQANARAIAKGAAG
ncbi:MAG TPA: glutathione S-transferase family protein [Caulobacteraceae bacterium]|jgi:glutathione S-transferase|nr:glutathione S-transferase family protein [Caulobacteraceae bacterium]